jgi:hypothetical protein
MGKTRSTLIMDEDLWKRFRMIAILNNMEVSELVDQALREKLERMKQLEQYPEYKDVQGLHVRSERQKGASPPQQAQQEDTVIHSSRYEAARGAQRQPKIINKIISLPGIEFPADRSKILKEAEKSTIPNETKYLKFIQNRKYKNESDLENELNRENSTKGTTMMFTVTNEKLRKEQENKVIS